MENKRAFMIIGLLVVSVMVSVFSYRETGTEGASDSREMSDSQEPVSDEQGEEAVTEEMRKRYGAVRFCGKDGDFYCYDTGEFTFYAQSGTTVRDNYEMQYYRYLTDSYFAGRNRGHDYEISGTGIGETYLPVINLNSSSSEEKEWFCSDVTNWLVGVAEQISYDEESCIYKTIGIAYRKERFTYQFQNLHTLTVETISDVYNEIYDFIEERLSESYREQAVENNKTDTSVDAAELSEETVQYYLSLEPECSDMSEGVEYRMVGVDRACGSSYYALIAVQNGERLVMVNKDPYLGSGGAAMWITFLDDGQTGFSCLAYSGGSCGSLYRTEDGGRSFQEVEYPSAKVRLPDGTYYNPFVMPEKVYEEGEVLYMEAGQGPNGDYYGENGFATGLYESKDRGKTWDYIGELSR